MARWRVVNALGLLFVALVFLGNIFSYWRQLRVDGGSSTTTATARPTQNEKKTQLPCWRRCDQRINKIAYFSLDRAGYSDRRTVILGLVDLAGYLCATVDFARPSLMLHIKHNQNKQIDPNISWKDFLNMSFLQDSSQALYDLDPIDGNLIKKPNLIEYKNKYEGWQIVVSDNSEQVLEHLAQMEQLSFHQAPNATTGFVWIIREWYHRFKNATTSWLSQGQKNCSYTHQDAIPVTIHGFMDSVMAEIRSIDPRDSTILGSFHIRRGDVKEWCDTSLERMKSFIQCSFNATQGRNVTVMFGSDETNATYRQSIMGMLDELGHVRAIDIDDLVWNHMEAAAQQGKLPRRNLINMYRYAIIKELRTVSSAFLLQQRKQKFCADCSPIRPDSNGLLTA